MLRIAGCLALLLGVVSLPACGGGGTKAPTLEVVDGPFAGDMSLTLEPSVVGDNTLTLELRDASGDPLEGATVKVSPWMPAHGHGSADVMLEERDPGRYVGERVYFNMPGIWELRIHIDADREEGNLVGSTEVL